MSEENQTVEPGEDQTDGMLSNAGAGEEVVSVPPSPPPASGPTPVVTVPAPVPTAAAAPTPTPAQADPYTTNIVYSWFMTLARLFRSNPGVGNPLVNPTITTAIKHSWLWVSAPVVLALSSLVLSETMASSTGAGFFWYAFSTSSPQLALQVFLGGTIFVFGRAAALVLIFKIGNRSLNFGEALDLAGITLVLAPVVLLLTSLFFSVNLGSVSGFLGFIATMIALLLSEIGLYEAVRGRGNFDRPNSTSYVVVTAIILAITSLIAGQILDATAGNNDGYSYEYDYGYGYDYNFG